LQRTHVAHVELKSCGRPEAWGDEASWKVNSAHESLHTDVSSIFVLNKSELILSLYYKIDKNACISGGFANQSARARRVSGKRFPTAGLHVFIIFFFGNLYLLSINFMYNFLHRSSER